MKIIVITYLNSLSPGTFLQAYGLQKGLKKEFKNADIYFLNSKNVTKNVQNIKINISKINLAKQKIFAFIRLLQVYILQKKHFKIIGKKIDLYDFESNKIADFINKFDLLVIGSDTILEKISHSNKNQIGIMWPDDKIKIRRIYFAASAAPGNLNLTEKIKEILKARIEKFIFIGLRDDITINLFKNILAESNVRLVKQPDPSYFIDLSEFKLPIRFRYKLNKKKKYCFFTFNSKFQYRMELSVILKDYGFTLISAQFIPEADICLATIDPLQWGGIFKYCDLIVTERFHDTVFALRHCKPVITIDWDENRFSSGNESKTKSILKDYVLEKNHLIIHEYKDLQKVNFLIENNDLFDSISVKETNEKIIKDANTAIKKIYELL